MAAQKFGRNFSLTVELSDSTTLLLEPPFTIEFEVSRKLMASPADCQIRIYNLSEKNRNLIRYDISNYQVSNRFLTFRAGYGTNLPVIFYGNITTAWSVREGNNFITTIECFDGGTAYLNGEISPTKTFPQGMKLRDLYGTLMGEGLPASKNTYLPGTTFGYIGDNFVTDRNGLAVTKTRGESPVGNTVNYLRSQVKNAFFIDNGKSFILGNNECRKGEILLIDSSTGLLGTPLRQNNIVTFEMMFEPSIIIGQMVQLKSRTLSGTNRTYKVNTIKHRGMISETVCGSVITTLEIFVGPGVLQVVTDQ